MHAFDILGDPVRRRILELLADGEQTSGAITDVIRAEFAISQPAVSQHLRVLRDSGFTSVRAQGTRRFYAIEPAPLSEVDAWLDRFRRLWEQRLDALGTELARGRRARRTPTGAAPTRPTGSGTDAGKADPPPKGHGA
ncbi:Transcriptional regulator, ArsR family [Actinokineospora spheciospongiae]|uniref:Transcriptional regulator, ArsR family n=1 Tax=Actinokineospora spheciospongiae TaxID=909613 RepID=W7IPX2_9PSEU|nr:metalloregulator ArsR/SmtB family transcription factor [Actinokineospora spheciospongiae]EWC62438.1 Transcriptional regulator, ArsR family [Actinokineospora spheciospongiae]